MARADDRRFAVYPRGHVRDNVILENFRTFLRDAINPDTGVLFTEDEIARITQHGSRYWIEADAIDLVGQAAQQRGLWLADQTDPRRASTSMLRKVHGPLWVGDPLPASPGSGQVSAPAPDGTIFRGSTTLGDPSAQVAVDPAGKRYQVMFTTTIATDPITGNQTPLTLRAIDAGSNSNLAAGAILKWASPPPGAAPECTVSTDFTGGFEAETDQEYAGRIADAIRYRAGSGNWAQFRAWAEASSVAIEDAYVYSCIPSAGSVHVCVVQRRGTAVGPNARIPNSATLTDATAYLVPPNSPVVPEHVHVQVSPPVPQSTDVDLRVSMAGGTTTGWADADPWPANRGGVTTITSPTVFEMVAPDSSTPPSPPQIMVWATELSRWEKLDVQSVVHLGGEVFEVTLAAAPQHALLGGDRISPYTPFHDDVARVVEAYFDELGPGELVASSDARFERGKRFPRPGDYASFRVSQALTSRLRDGLGAVVDDAQAEFLQTAPDLPADVSDGPTMLVLGRVSLAPL